jgi:transposase
MFGYSSTEERVPPDHPLRASRVMVDMVLKELSPQGTRLSSHTGRPSMAAEKLLRALLLQVLHPVRSERWLMAQLADHLRFRWLVGRNMDEPVWEASTFSKNRQRLLEGDVAHAFFAQVLAPARERALWADDHITVDGTLIEAWAGQKSCQRKDAVPPSPPPDDPGNPSLDFRGERRTNATHASTTDPEARLYKKAKGQEATLADLGQVLMEDRHGLVVDTRVTQATWTAEREAALTMAEAIPGEQRVTWGAAKHDDTRDLVQQLCALRVTPHVAPHTSGRSSERWPHDSPCRLCGASAATAMRGRDLWLDENGGAVAPDSASWSGASGVDVHRRGRRIQPRADAHTGSRGMSHMEAMDEPLPYLAALAPTGSSTPRDAPTLLPFPIRN